MERFALLSMTSNGLPQALVFTYDLTRCTEGYNGEHATSVNGTGHPTLDDMIAVGVKNKMTESKCREIYEEVKSVSSNVVAY